MYAGRVENGMLANRGNKVTLTKRIFVLFVLLQNAGLMGSATAAERGVPNPGSLELVDMGWQTTSPQGLLVKAHTKYFIVFEGVVPPTVHSMILLEHTKINKGDAVLDLGTGSGVQAIFAAENAEKIVATDIDPKAVKNALYNVERYELQKRIDVRQGDLFAPIRSDEKFDVIIFSLIYPFSDATEHLWEVHRRFFREAHKYLKPNGRIYYQAGHLDNIPQVKEMVEANGFEIAEMHMYLDRHHAREPIVFSFERKR